MNSLLYQAGLLGFVARELLAQRSRGWVVQVHSRHLGHTPLEPLIELVLGLRKLTKRIGEVGALYVGEQEVSLRRVLYVPCLLGDVYAPLGGT